MHETRAYNSPIIQEQNMKKFFLAVAAIATIIAATSCGSLRTPSGENNGKIWYQTFFGLSLDSAVAGDGFVVNQK